MAIPPTALTFANTLDPHEELDFLINCDQILEAGEEVEAAGWTLELLAEAAALGLTIMSGGTPSRDAALQSGNQSILFWLIVDGAYQDNAAFDGSGTALPLRITAETNSSPARTRQRTFQVQVAQL